MSPAPLPRRLDTPTTPSSTGPAARSPVPDAAKSAANVQYTEAPTPTSSAPASSGPDRGQTNHDHESGGTGWAARATAAATDRSARAASSVANTAISANAAHALRQLAPASSAIGTAIATPQPVPELMIASARPCRARGSDVATAVANGGYASAALAPATTTPR